MRDLLQDDEFHRAFELRAREWSWNTAPISEQQLDYLLEQLEVTRLLDSVFSPSVEERGSHGE